jgi:pimeloyl-ACP methyl ester carboxylesterase
MIFRGCLAALLSAFLALQACAVIFAKHEARALPGASVHVLVTNGFTIRWVGREATATRGLDLAFIHGTPGEAGVWTSQFQSLTNRNLFAYDRPGFRGSKPALRQPHLENQVEGLLAWLACATTNRVLLVGHSYGSPIALLAALEHPEKISGVVLIGGDVDPGWEKPWFIQYLFGCRLTSWVLPSALRQCNRELLTAHADLTALRKLLPQLTVPVVMLHGDRDPLVPVENVAWLEHQLAGFGKSNFCSRLAWPCRSSLKPRPWSTLIQPGSPSKATIRSPFSPTTRR